MKKQNKMLAASILGIFLCLCTACGSTAQSTQSESVPASSAVSEPESADESGPVFAITVPDGFTETEMPGTLAYYTSEDGAVISLTTSSKDPDFGNLDADALVEALRALYAEQLRDDALKIEILSTASEPVCGFSAYQLELKCTGEGYEFYQLFVGIDGDMTYSWVFSGSAEQLELFRECADSISNTVEM